MPHIARSRRHRTTPTRFLVCVERFGKAGGGLLSLLVSFTLFAGELKGHQSSLRRLPLGRVAAAEE